MTATSCRSMSREAAEAAAAAAAALLLGVDDEEHMKKGRVGKQRVLVEATELRKRVPPGVLWYRQDVVDS